MSREELLKNAKPILFNTEMVQSILIGRKTVTRRKIDKDIINHCDIDTDGVLLNYQNTHGDFINPVDLCRYKIGDILYIREKFNNEETDLILYAADKEFIDFGCKEVNGYLFMESDIKWKPSIYMPKEVARIFLKVTNVRVERLQDTTEEQAIKEGIKDNMGITVIGARWQFKVLWNSTIKKQDIGKYDWDSNPWVWVIEFEVIQQN